MQTMTQTQQNPFGRTTAIITRRTGRLRTGYLLSGLAVSFLLLDAVGKLVEAQPVIAATVELGYSQESVFTLGVILLSCLIAYVVPRTSVLGAILLTGYLGGAIATHVRVGSPLFTHALFPVYLGALLWGGLLLRDERLRVLLPLRSGR